MNEALAAQTADSQAASFFFFDFDGTLSMQYGLQRERWEAANWNVDAILVDLFGDEERRRLLVEMLGTLLDAKVCFVLTANQAFELIAWLLNKLLDRGGAQMRFKAGDTVVYSSSGSKSRRIETIVESRGFALYQPSQVCRGDGRGTRET